MLTKHLDVTYSIIWTLTLSHIMGALICLCASGLFARMALIRVGILVPAVLAIIFLGAFDGSHSWGDLYVVAGFGALGWTMKQLGWPRPPLILGVVLGGTFERYLFISQELFGWSALARPVVAIVLLGSAWVILKPVMSATRRILAGKQSQPAGQRGFQLNWNVAFTAAALVITALALWQTEEWPAHARIVPLAAGGAALLFGLGTLLTEMFARRQPKTDLVEALGLAVPHPQVDSAALALGGTSIEAGLRRRRALRFFLWLSGLLAAMLLIGLLPGLAVLMVLLVTLEFGESWRTGLALSACMSLAFWLLFDRLFATPWPDALAGDLWPGLRSLTHLL